MTTSGVFVSTEAAWLEPFAVLSGEVVIGIDPGTKGAIAALLRMDSNGTLCGLTCRPRTLSAWVEAIRAVPSLSRVRGLLVEDVRPVPPIHLMDVVLHKCVGVIEGALWSMAVPWAKVPAREWRAGLKLSRETDYKARKKANAERVKGLWPSHAITVEAADAGGIALYQAVNRGWVTI